MSARPPRTPIIDRVCRPPRTPLLTKPPRTPVLLPAVIAPFARTRSRDHEQEIVKRLERVASHAHVRNADVFVDWLDMVSSTLDMLPAHAKSIAEHKRPADDTPQIAAQWLALREKYPVEVFEHFGAAFGILLDSTIDDEQPTYRDVIGPVYMAFGHPNINDGQFFTPPEIARVMALMIMSDIMEKIRERLRAAIVKTPTLAMLVVMRGDTLGEESDETLERIALYADVDPILVNDPCCGAGGMFLAAASTVPSWVIRAGLIRFYGMDIDALCVKMARLNCRLFGLQ